MEVEVTVLGDSQKLEMQPEVCLDTHMLVRGPTQRISKKAGVFHLLKDSGKCLEAYFGGY